MLPNAIRPIGSGRIFVFVVWKPKRFATRYWPCRANSIPRRAGLANPDRVGGEVCMWRCDATRLDPLLSVFDAPEPNMTLGRRDSTNVPAQSLTLLNDRFVIGLAQQWADSVAGSPAKVTSLDDAAVKAQDWPDVRHGLWATGNGRRVEPDVGIPSFQRGSGLHRGRKSRVWRAWLPQHATSMENLAAPVRARLLAQRREKTFRVVGGSFSRGNVDETGRSLGIRRRFAGRTGKFTRRGQRNAIVEGGAWCWMATRMWKLRRLPRRCAKRRLRFGCKVQTSASEAAV